MLSCIDSRVPAELVLDQGVGDIFNIRIAGNFLNDDILGSLEFACCVAGAKLIVVMGQSACGAVKGACDNVELGHLTGMLKKIRPAIDAVDSPREPENRCSANADFVESVARENVRRTVAGIAERSEVLRELRDTGAIEIVGAMYDVSSGSVEFL